MEWTEGVETGRPSRMSRDEPLRLYSALLDGMLGGSEELFGAQEFLHALIQTVSVPVFIKDRSSTFISCNSAFAEWVGMTVSEVIGRRDSEMPWRDLSGADYVDWDRRVMDSGVESLGMREPLELEDGTVRWLETDKYPVIAKDGEVVGLLGSFRDVTERVESERALQRLVGNLDQQVDQKAAELERMNHSLRGEMRERERLQIEEREQREKLEVLGEIAATLSSTLDLDAVLDKVVAGVQRLLFVDLISVVLVDENDRDFVVRRLDVTDGYVIAEPTASDAMLGWLLGEDGPGDQNGATRPVPREHCLGPARSAIAAVMVVGGERVGYLLVESRAGHLASGFAIGRLSAVAAQAAATMSTIRLSADAAGRAALRERERLAQDLHDTVIQAVSTISLLSDAARTMVDPSDPVAALIERMHDASVGSQAEMRSLLFEMRPGELAKLSLRELVETAIAVFSARSRVRVVADLDDVDLDDADSIVVYRIVQEALSNVLRHANASVVTIVLRSDPILLCVVDDGDGFETTASNAGHLGMSIMSERAASIGGTLTISSAPGDGSRVCLVLGQEPTTQVAIDADDEDAGQGNGPRRSVVHRVAARRRSIARARSRHRRSPLTWALVTLALALPLVLAISANRSATNAATEAQDAVDQSTVLGARVSVVRALLDELNADVLEPFGAMSSADRNAARERSLAAVVAADAALGATDVGGAAAQEAAHVRGILAGLLEPPSRVRPEYLEESARRVQLDGVPSAEQQGEQLGSLREAVWLDQVITDLLHDSAVARFRFLDEPPTATARTNDYLAALASSVERRDGWLGPEETRPLIGGPLETAATERSFPDLLESLNDVISMSLFVAEDRWVSLAGDEPEPQPPMPLRATVVAGAVVVGELRELIDGELASFVETQTDERQTQSRRADLWMGVVALTLAGLVLAAGRMVVLLIEASRELARAARVDPLTGIGNRKVLESDTSRHLADSDLVHHLIVTIDMDQFKLTNDLYGHAFGDQLLAVTAAGLADFADAGLADASTAVRLGGDEFLLSLHSRTAIDGERVRSELDRLRERLVSADDGTFVHPRFSYGLAFAVGSPDLTTLMRTSDLAAYEDKAQRRRHAADQDAEEGSISSRWC